ncbi:MAG TPA: lytic transglycosylase domain-containing protein [Alphaproteobacteria bacterium]|nr:lytic transglycosylase domain-containing protein [Alphaproteobacteria bacterium]HOO50905.1 lytic transglycosylase domain-containing protein [Alphaproteobacteria bacterium]
MHNDDIKKGIQLALAAVCLLSGVVCGIASDGSANTRMSLSQALMKPDLTHGFELGRSNKATTETSTSQITIALPEDYSAEVKVSSGYRLVEKAVRAELRQGRPTAALKLLSQDATAKKLKSAEFDRVKAQIAQSYLMEGKIDRAAEVAEEVVQRSGKLVPLSGWVAGQAAWRNEDFGRAADMFAMTARSKVASPWLISGGAYWAARASFRAGRFSDVRDWQEIAAQHPRTFYGMVALKALGRSYDFNRDIPVLSALEKNELSQSASLKNAIQNTKSGKVIAAIENLSKGGWLSSDAKRSQALAYVSEHDVPALVLYLARKTKSKDGRFYDLALYPESPWEPKNGYQVDKAIVHALIRQESRFNPHATSYVGAKGLMQLMPETAKFVAKTESIALTDPMTNIEIGQKYVGQLLRDPVVNNDLFKMAIAYNAGPGNLSKWKKQLSDVDDPLLFIESIPSSETRAFVERVMVNYWMYRTRMGQDVPSLDAVASLDRPDYLRVAQNIGSNIFALAVDR